MPDSPDRNGEKALRRCGHCSQDNPADTRFCGACGKALGNACPQCGYENTPGFRFCGQCATPLSGAPAPAPVPPPAPAPAPADATPLWSARESMVPLRSLSIVPGTPAPPSTPAPTGSRAPSVAERRQLTVLFCDLVGSTELSEQLDPEEFREVIRGYQTTSGEVIGRYEGHVAQYLGDGLLVYFGYPLAHEDDARRAVLTGLEIIAAIGRLNDRHVHPTRIAVRVGIDTGFGVAGDVGDGGRREQLMVGRTPNVAARLQSLARPDTVLVTEATRRLVTGLFVFDPLGPQAIKGVAAPVEVFRAVSASGVSGRFEASTHHGLSPFVGRETELAVVRDRYHRAVAGVGQAMLLSAEPGLGKSRLLHEAQGLAQDTADIMVGHCSPYFQTRAFHPLVGIYQHRLGFERDDTPAQRLAKIEQRFTDLGLALDEAVPLLAAFLDVPLSGRWQPLALSPQKQREHTLQLILKTVHTLAARKPLVMIIEDLHWADPSTLEFLGALIDAVAQSRVLALLTCRPVFRSPWTERPALTTLDLHRLHDGDVRRIVESVTEGLALPAEVLVQIAERSDGVPLFVEELTKATLESGLLAARGDHYDFARPFERQAVPSSLRDSLTARLDRLGPAKEVAQLAAAIGRLFVWELLTAVTADPAAVYPGGAFPGGTSPGGASQGGTSQGGPGRDDPLRPLLDQLLEAELVFRDEESDQVETYRFKHALVRDTAYESMLKSRRREIHERIARTLEGNFPDIATGSPELLASHFAEAGLVDDAVRYLHRAGQQAMARSAHAEALADFSRCIQLLAGVPPTSERYVAEVSVRTSMMGSQVATQGYCAPDLERNCVRARELCALLGDPPALFPILYHLWVVNLATSRRAATEDYDRQVVAFMLASPDGLRAVTGNFAHGTTLLYRGHLEASRAAFHQVLGSYSPAQHGELVRTYGDDHGLFAQVYLQWLELLSGDPARARATGYRTLALADALRDPLARTLALVFAMILRHDLDEPEDTLAFSERAMALADDQGFPFWSANGLIGHGWVRARRGEHAEGIREIEQGLAFFHLIQQKLPYTYWASYLVEALLLAGEHARGLKTVDELLAMAAVNVDSFYGPELWRLKGDLLTASDAPVADALACYESALAAAEASGAAFLGLRAAVRVARTLDRQGQRESARTTLSAALARVDGRDDTQDHRSARALLDTLGRPLSSG